jgi:hypothetical protein
VNPRLRSAKTGMLERPSQEPLSGVEPKVHAAENQTNFSSKFHLLLFEYFRRGSWGSLSARQASARRPAVFRDPPTHHAIER